ncbi:MAG: hypothetical protein IKG04_01505 [Exiguobacterium sp.]|nr:hypothetical protein [Exiguobacterium sp.]
MLVQCKQTKRELEMFWIEVEAFKIPEVNKILKRYTRGSDEDYNWSDADDPYSVRCRIVATDYHHGRIVSELARKKLLEKYEYECWN